MAPSSYATFADHRFGRGDVENVLNEFPRVSHNEADALKPTVVAVNIKDYGATGNGTTDDTFAIRAAISAALSGTIKTVYFYFLSGNYLVSGAEERGHALKDENFVVGSCRHMDKS